MLNPLIKIPKNQNPTMMTQTPKMAYKNETHLNQDKQQNKTNLQNKKMQAQHQPVIKFTKQYVKKNNIYFTHEATVDNQKCLAKLFNQQIIQKYGLDEALEYQIQVFTESHNMIYPDQFMHLQAASSHGDSVVLITKHYDQRLDQLIRSSPLQEEKAMKIFQHIIKAVYALIMEGYSHRNLRAEHFVRVGEVWKLETVVYEEIVNSKGLQCQYVYNAEYKPPEAYTRPNFTEEELEKRIVWDLGCLFISMILGGHRLKNQAMLNKFKGKPFSFEAIGAKAGEKTSPQLKQMLGKMCHYNEDQRMDFPQLLLSGFFSKEVYIHYKKYKESKKSKIFLSNSNSVSQSLSNKGKKQQVPVPEEFKDLLRSSQQKEDNLSKHGEDNKIFNYEGFKKKVQQVIIEEDFEESSVLKKNKIKNISDISSKNYDEMIDFYKNYLDKGQILAIGGKKFEKMKGLFNDPGVGKDIIAITEYALKFVQVMDLCRLATAMNQNREFFEFKKNTWESFHGSPQYKAIKEIINSKKNTELKVLEEYRNKLIKDNNRFVVIKNKIKQFVQDYSAEELRYADIKQPYRKILKVSYDTIAEHYTSNKTEQWAQLGMYITFCIAIDKYYISEDFKSNFKFYFNWSKKQPTNYVSLYDFQNYLDNAPRALLVENSRYIMQKYFNV